MKTTLVIVAGIAACLAASGPAMAKSLTLNLDPFRSATISSAIDAKFVVGPEQSVALDVDDALALKSVRVEVVDGELRAWVNRDFWDLWRFRAEAVHLTVTVPALDAIAASEASHVEVAGMSGDHIRIDAHSAASIALSDVAAETANLSAGSAARLSISGACDRAVVHVESVARIEAGGFKCTDLAVVANSVATARLSGSGKVDVDASSLARIELVGRPLGLNSNASTMSGIDIIE